MKNVLLIEGEDGTRTNSGSFGNAHIQSTALGTVTDKNHPLLDTSHWSIALVSPITDESRAKNAVSTASDRGRS